MDNSRCSKTKFATEKDANYFIEKMQKTSSRKVKPVKSYLCPKCTRWHLSSSQDHKTSLREIELENSIKQARKEIDDLRCEVRKLRTKLRKHGIPFNNLTP
jgi:molybdenum cofactor biosynthesis enzyme MoaA